RCEPRVDIEHEAAVATDLLDHHLAHGDLPTRRPGEVPIGTPCVVVERTRRLLTSGYGTRGELGVRRRHTGCRERRVLVLPETDDSPSGSRQELVGVQVARAVRGKLGRPPRLVGAGLGPV